MNVWLIKDGEPLPLDSADRPMRTAMLAQALLRRGHDVTWWSSTFSHQHKKLWEEKDERVTLGENYRLNLIHAGSFRRNISVRRYLHHRKLARRFRAKATMTLPPDVIVTSFPQIHLAAAAVRYGAEHDIPVLIDVRDLWPDVMVDMSPEFLKPIVRLGLASDYYSAACAFAGATALIGISQGYLDWSLRLANRERKPTDRVFYLSYPGPEVSQSISGSQATAELPQDKVLFTFVGSFGHSYELDLICTVARHLAAEGNTRAHFVLVGNGEQFETVSQLAKDMPNMTVTGWLDAKGVAAVLDQTDVGLLPCLHVKDSLPNKFFEYLSRGLPLLSSLTGEASLIISNNEIGYSYRAGAVDELAQKITLLAQNAELRVRQSGNSKTLFERRFSPAATYDAYAAHVESFHKSPSSAQALF